MRTSKHNILRGGRDKLRVEAKISWKNMWVVSEEMQHDIQERRDFVTDEPKASGNVFEWRGQLQGNNFEITFDLWGGNSAEKTVHWVVSGTVFHSDILIIVLWRGGKLS